MKFGEEELTFLSIFDGGEKSRQNTIQNSRSERKNHRGTPYASRRLFAGKRS